MAINFDQNRGSLLGINNNNNINSNQIAFLPEFLENLFSGDPANIQIGEEGSPIDKAKDALQENKQKSLPTPEEIEGKTSSLGLPSDNLTAMAIANYDNLFAPKTLTDAFGVDRTIPGLDRPENLYTGKFNVMDGLPNDGITNNVRFRDMLLKDIKNLPSDIRTSLGTVKNFATDLKDKGIDLGSLAISGIGNAIAPGLGFAFNALTNLKETPQQKAIKEFYEQNFGLTDTGQVASGIMQGYNPVYGFGGAGLQGAIDKRLATILKTEERKKKKGLELSQELLNRRRELEALKERDRIAKANIAATPGFDVSGGAGGNYDRSFDYGANTREAQDRRSSDLGFSDIRLKENIELIGKSPSNINIYKFNYKDNPTTYQGVMAHEVPWANVKHSNGYMMVDYNKVDVKFKKWQK